jgi:hypothetical protein
MRRKMAPFQVPNVSPPPRGGFLAVTRQNTLERRAVGSPSTSDGESCALRFTIGCRNREAWGTFIDRGCERMQRRLGDRRERRRFEIVGELWGTLDTAVEMRLLEVGLGGALVQSSVPLVPQTVHHVAVTCEGQQTTATVQVRHVRERIDVEGCSDYLLGLEFLSLPPMLRAQIEAWSLGGSAAEGV